MILRRMPSLPDRATGVRQLDEARRELERLFATLSAPAERGSAGVFPAVNVTENSDSLYLRAELPGIDASALEITVEDQTLTIAGNRQPPSEDPDVSYHRREREWGAFRRSFSLATRIDSGRVEARYVDGILTVTLPKAAEARPRQISIQAGG